MEMLIVRGGKPVRGEVAVSGSTRASLWALAASILVDDPLWLENVPQVEDVDVLSLALGHVGMEVKRQRDGRHHVTLADAASMAVDYRLMRRLPECFSMLGPLLARRGRAVMPLPGAGVRPDEVDLQLYALRQMGASIRCERGQLIAEAKRLHGARLCLQTAYGSSADATAHLLMAAPLAEGDTTILAAATDPDVIDLGRLLVAMGARITGLGTSTVEVRGGARLAGTIHRVTPDAAETAFWLWLTLATGGETTLAGAIVDPAGALAAAATACGGTLTATSSGLHVQASVRLRGVDLYAAAHPGLSSLELLFAGAALTGAVGRSNIVDALASGNLARLAELRRMGAEIAWHGASTTITGIEHLHGAEVEAQDCESAATLLLAALAAEGETSLVGAQWLNQRFERLPAKLAALQLRCTYESAAPARLLGLPLAA